MLGQTGAWVSGGGRYWGQSLTVQDMRGKEEETKCPAGFSGAQAHGRHFELLVCPPAAPGQPGGIVWGGAVASVPQFLHLLQQSESPFEPQFTCPELSSSLVLTKSMLSHLRGEHSKGFQG